MPGRRGNKKVAGSAPGQTLAGRALSIAKTAAKAIVFIKGMINCEKQYFDQKALGASVNWSGTVNLLSGMAEGDDNTERKGNSILARGLTVRLDPTGNGVQTACSIRCIIVQDKDNQGTDPTAADILQNTGSAYATVSPLNVDHLPRYRVLLDKHFPFTTTGEMKYYFQKRINLKSHLKYTGPLATDIYKGALYMLNISDVNTNTPALTWHTRLEYYDN